MRTRYPHLRIAALCIIVGLSAGCASSPTQESAGEVVDSSLITTKVKAALAGEEAGSLLEIEVETFRDVVQLSGFVDSEQDKARAEQIAQEVEGVSTVENDLVIKSSS